MRLAGYVHRDISPGNSLIYDNQVKISDLEYARRYEDISLHNSPLTVSPSSNLCRDSLLIFFSQGTPAFMAVEYQRRRHMFQPSTGRYKFNRTDNLEPQWFKFNFLHDLESVAWIYAWHLFHTIPDGLCTPDTRDARLAIQAMAVDLFHGSVEGSTLRTLFLERVKETEGVFRQALNTLTSAYTSKVGHILVKGLAGFQTVVNCYLTVEATTPLDADDPKLTRWDPTLFDRKFHDVLRDWFRKIHSAVMRHAEGANLVSVSLEDRPSTPDSKSSAKRKGDDPDELEGSPMRQRSRTSSNAKTRAAPQRSKKKSGTTSGTAQRGSRGRGKSTKGSK